MVQCMSCSLYGILYKLVAGVILTVLQNSVSPDCEPITSTPGPASSYRRFSVVPVWMCSCVSSVQTKAQLKVCVLCPRRSFCK